MRTLTVWGKDTNEATSKNHYLVASQVVSISRDSNGYADVYMMDGRIIQTETDSDDVLKRLRKARRDWLKWWGTVGAVAVGAYAVLVFAVMMGAIFG
jgi:hypothetical protein